MIPTLLSRNPHIDDVNEPFYRCQSRIRTAYMRLNQLT